MKKKVLLSLLVFVLAFCFIGCGGDDDPPTSPPGNSGGGTPPQTKEVAEIYRGIWYAGREAGVKTDPFEITSTTIVRGEITYTGIYTQEGGIISGDGDSGTYAYFYKDDVKIGVAAVGPAGGQIFFGTEFSSDVTGLSNGWQASPALTAADLGTSPINLSASKMSSNIVGTWTGILVEDGQPDFTIILNLNANGTFTTNTASGPPSGTYEFDRGAVELTFIVNPHPDAVNNVLTVPFSNGNLDFSGVTLTKQN